MLGDRDFQSEQKFCRALEKPLAVDLQAMPLQDVIDYLAGATGVPLSLSRSSANGSSPSPDTQVTLRTDLTSGRSVMELVLGQCNLSWGVVHETLLVLDMSRASEELRTRVYLVNDLLGTNANGEGDYDSLIGLISVTIAPTSWHEAGGSGSVREFRPGRALVISQTRDVHEQTAGLLTNLREARRRQRLAPPAAVSR